jgi:hypothetical protein
LKIRRSKAERTLKREIRLVALGRMALCQGIATTWPSHKPHLVISASARQLLPPTIGCGLRNLAFFRISTFCLGFSIAALRPNRY